MLRCSSLKFGHALEDDASSAGGCLADLGQFGVHSSNTISPPIVNCGASNAVE